MKKIIKDSNSENKGNQELLQELAEIRNTLKNQEKKFEACEEELQNAKKQIGSLQDLEAKLNSAEKQLKELDKIKEDSAILEKRLVKAEQEASKRIETVNNELKVSERERTKFLNKIKQLERNIDSLTNQLEIDKQHEKEISKAIPTTKSSFRVDIYPYQGHFQGKIEHLLSKDKRAFKNLDDNAIKDFISRHLPSLDENQKETKPGISSGAFTLVSDDLYEDLKVTKTDIPSGAFTLVSEDAEVNARKLMTTQMPILRGIKLLQAGTPESGRVIRQSKPFEVIADFNFEGVYLNSNQPVVHEIAVFARPMAGEARQSIAEAHGEITSSHESTIKMNGKSLPEGTYRLGAAVKFSRPKEKPRVRPTRSLFSGDLFHVC